MKSVLQYTGVVFIVDEYTAEGAHMDNNFSDNLLILYATLWTMEVVSPAHDVIDCIQDCCRIPLFFANFD